MGINGSDSSGGQQRLVEGALDTLRPGWRERRAKRKSAWNLLGALLIILGLGVFWYGLWLGAWRVHAIFYPAHAAHLKQFWQSGLSGGAFISSFLLVIPLFVPAIVLACLASNLLMWLIPPARRAMNAEAAGDYEMTFRGANWGLMKWGGIASGIALTAAVIGAATLTSLR
jgi:hypothetical protein